MGSQNSKESLYIRIIEGETQSHELFDFQNMGAVQLEQPIISPSYLVSDGVSISYQSSIKQQEPVIPNPTTMFEIKESAFRQIFIRDIGAEAKSLWRVIQQGEAYPLKIGDILKIGKIKIEFKKLVTRKGDSNQEETVKDEQRSLRAQQDPLLNENNSQQDHQGFNDHESVKTDRTNCDRCRVCFGSNNHKGDPLLCLCKCSGSIKFIHFNCLKDWVSNNVTKREDENCNFYSFYETCCELCKHPIPSQFEHSNRNYSLFSFKTFEVPFAQFEYSEVENGKRKIFKYMINLSNGKQVSIGRNNTSQVVMKDISISRSHCSLEYREGMLLMRDKKSKFGTLIKVEKTIEFEPQTGLQLQLDSKIVELHKKGTFRNCCCADVDTYKIVFEESGVSGRHESSDRPPDMQLEEPQEEASQESESLSQPSLNNRVTMIRDRRPSEQN